MADSLLVDLDADGSMRVSVLRDGDLPSAVSGDVPSVEWPLGAAELGDLRWYLERYLSAPYAVYEDRGVRVAASLADWGRRVFTSVFGAGPARDAYVGLRSSGEPFEVVFRSAAPGVLGLPWELMQDPSRPEPMVLDGVRISRSLPTGGTEQAFKVNGERLRVLMVISRPLGVEDVAYQMIARALVSRLSGLRGQVELVVLRPPTLEGLRAELARAEDAGVPYQIVHFDGHGALYESAPQPSGVFRGGAQSGTLVFEKPGGGADSVDAGTFAQVLGRWRVPVVVLNACQSGAVGKELEAAVATRLLAQGTRAVVAMAYSVYATAAAEFMTAFYEQLFAGDLLSEAVVAGRARMAQQNLRPSPKGPLPLQDWLIPVLYTRSEVSFPQLKTTKTPATSVSDLLDAALGGDVPADEAPDSLAPVGQFVGRDDLFYRMETALQRRRGVVLHGPGGTGKTELAKAFGRWASATGGVDNLGLVVWHSFEPGVATFGLDGVVNTIGGQLFDARFHTLDPEQRLRLVTQTLAEKRMLLIWDNFESVASMADPDHATPPLSAAEKQRLADFLTRVTTGGGKSSVAVTSRTTEDWLDPGLVRLDVGGLTPNEAIQYASNLLAPLPVPQPHRDTRAFADLLVWLDGHPLSMRLSLPHLVTHSPSAILAGLTGEARDLTGSGDVLLTQVDTATRSKSLSASITYSYQHLSRSTQQLMPVLAMLQGVADNDVLVAFSTFEDVPERFRDVTVLEWKAALDQTSGVGLLTPLGTGMYRIHPALPAYLSDLWLESAGTDYTTERDRTEVALLVAYAVFGRWLSQQFETGNASLASSLIDAQRGTVGHFLALALTAGDFPLAQDMLQPLVHFLEGKGDHDAVAAWSDQVRLKTEALDGTPPRLDTPAGALWIYTVGAQASLLQKAGMLDQAETTYETILNMLQDHAVTNLTQRHIATSYKNLGVIAEDRGNLVEAERWYRKSLIIMEELGHRPGMASIYNNLGIIADLEGELDEAEQWCLKSLTIYEELGDQLETASVCHQLGVVALNRKELEKAEQWCRKSLTIHKNLEHQPNMAINYRQLGIAAQRRGEFEEAEYWYLKSLTIVEKLKDRSGMVRSYGQLGLLAEANGDPVQALQWTVCAATVFEEFPHPLTGPAPAHLVRMTVALGEPALARSWEQVTGQALPDQVRTFVANVIQELQNEPGKEGDE